MEEALEVKWQWGFVGCIMCDPHSTCDAEWRQVSTTKDYVFAHEFLGCKTDER
jgi:hypothetical protein